MLLHVRGGRNPLPVVGLALVVVGYVGVFFARMIKAVVSRQSAGLAEERDVAPLGSLCLPLGSWP